VPLEDTKGGAAIDLMVQTSPFGMLQEPQPRTFSSKRRVKDEPGGGIIGSIGELSLAAQMNQQPAVISLAGRVLS
jgi:hypothetical protein